jgi:hypothetical protein
MPAKRALNSVTKNKPRLFVIISVSMMAIFAIPVILPHITHPSMIYHIILHIVSLDLAVFLSVVSILSYIRYRNGRMLFLVLGFSLLVVIETLYLLHTSANIKDIIIPIVDAEFSHIILLIMLTLFGMGILKVYR